MSTYPTNSDDVIDSRDVIHAIEDLTAMRTDDPENFDEDDAETLASLEALAADAADYASDWHYGESLIRDSYFETYAQELADDIVGGEIRDLMTQWPMRCIDWKQAARELQQDYTAITWEGVTYWTR